MIELFLVIGGPGNLILKSHAHEAHHGLQLTDNKSLTTVYLPKRMGRVQVVMG